ncbi:hypothetical protein HKX48_009233 [Thoreauomyces humboldtii]|nr:hypothetical protein HKX48_009233 [Thoreauomyces humboldtii]
MDDREAVDNKTLQACLWCLEHPRHPKKGTGTAADRHSYCGMTCRREQLTGSPAITYLQANCEEYKKVDKLFIDGWLHPNRSRPRLYSIYKVISRRDVHRQYLAYRDKVQSSMGGVVVGGPGSLKGNEKLYFHGTRLNCNLGLPGGGTDFCDDPKCSTCGILKSSFGVRYANTYRTWGRYGKGIYFSQTSSKAHDYTATDTPPYHTVLLNRVVVGRAKILNRNSSDLVAPPVGHDSIVGQAGGGNLNYDELCLYADEAMIPAYLIIYEYDD